ncbi:hypothetical protein H9638_01290 [Arthrobacter sp. Sa2BUA2]|uniref:Uncharacterized protein n=1 Tax=Arthrobacter pullicola TaxID=2762224 RepID=A0ABR8YDY9_9MICC|nr:hypothetical protein [Arthrobacter pullicola]MBD8042436.1 hypothetical protein [Arthrobacter pullicola]
MLPSGREEFRRAAGRRAGIAGPATLVRRLAGVLRRRLAVNLATSQESLQEQEERQFNLLTHYINSGSRQ